MAIATRDQLAAERQVLLACASHFEEQLLTLRADEVHIRNVLLCERPPTLDHYNHSPGVSTARLAQGKSFRDRTMHFADISRHWRFKGDPQRCRSTTHSILNGCTERIDAAPSSKEMCPDRLEQLREEEQKMVGEDLLTCLVGSPWLCEDAPRALTTAYIQSSTSTKRFDSGLDPTMTPRSAGVCAWERVRTNK